MDMDVRRVMNTCLQCWQHATSGPRSFPMRALPRGWPGEVVAMYMFGPLTETTRGATIILVLIDHFTRWVELTALRKVEVTDVVSCLRDRWVPQHGVPAALLSDNGPQFVATVLRDFCVSMGIKKLDSTPYYPKGSSIVESFMRTLRKALAALVNEEGNNWDTYLSVVALAHNSTPHMSTGFFRPSF
ncbi:gag-pol fusion protein [Cystoisospora suis]|uniref:Gag-pol fusion protein n=1 Tax=Cystoisospora suis TaxID=483139 RepID=A0A2C6K5V2_9APIC|nr:gag-pol fusion protein [Cystoisospora suis]